MSKNIYAKNTTIKPEKSREEIMALLKKYKCDGFGYAQDGKSAQIRFRREGLMIALKVDIPDKEQKERSQWRALLLVLKAKLVAVDQGVRTFEQEFLADVILPNGQTYGEFAIPQIEAVYTTGKLPRLLLGSE